MANIRSYKTNTPNALTKEIQEEIKQVNLGAFGVENTPDNLDVFYTVYQTNEGEWAIMLTATEIDKSVSAEPSIVHMNDAAAKIYEKLETDSVW